MQTIYGSPGYGSPGEADGELGYVLPRQVNFGWIGEAFGLFGARAGVWIGCTVIAFVVPYLLLFGASFLLGDPMNAGAPGTGAHSSAGNGAGLVLFVLELLLYVVILFFCGSLYRMANQQVRGLPIEFRDVFRGGPVFGRVLGYGLLFGLACLGMELVCFAPFGLTLFASLHAGAHAPLSTPGGPSSAVMGMILTGIGWFVLGLLLTWAAGLVLIGLLSPGFALVADGQRVLSAWRRSIHAMRGQWLTAAGLAFVTGLIVLVSELPCGLGLLVTLPMVFLMTSLAYRDMIGMPGRVVPSPVYSAPQPGVWPPPPTASPPDV